jgi:hypothetical protein
VLLAVDLDNQLPLEAQEIDGVGQDRNLPLELETVEAAGPQRLPKRVLCRRRGFA